MPKVTIITPVYCDIPEKTDWLIETIESVRSQTLRDWEMILVDDKSPFEPLQARRNWIDDERIRWFDLAENSGPAKARNLAAELAESDCLLPLDADDMLPSPETLEDMYDIWMLDKTKIIYGNLQYYINEDGKRFRRRPDIISLPDYNFDNTGVMLDGAMPVTAMHSIDCHFAAGGWKSIFDYGFEDVEYWYAAGLAGYCGLRANMTTLLYRKHQSSRTATIQANNKLIQMQMKRKIIDLYPDPIKRSVYPMSCCGGKNNQSQVQVSNDPLMASSQGKVAQGMVVPLEGFNEDELEWVIYDGPKKGRFDVLIGGSSYTIFGTGQVFQIHKSHRDHFVARQRHGFKMNQQDPRNRQEVEAVEPEISIQEMERPQVFSAGRPELPVVERIDHIAAKTRQVEIVKQEVINEPNASQSYSNFIPGSIDLKELNVSEGIRAILSKDNWTVNRIASATPNQLSALPGIGIKRASSLIEKAQGLL